MRPSRTLIALILLGGVVFGCPAQAAGEAFAVARPEIAQAIAAAPALPGAGLFNAIITSAPETPSQARPGTLRERAAALNPSYLQALIGSRPFVLDATGAMAGTPDRAVLNLFNDLSLTIVKLSQSRSALGQQVLRAAVLGADGNSGSATIVIENGGVTARITAGARSFMVEPAADGAHRITEFAAPPAESPNDTQYPPLAPGDLNTSPNTTLEKPNASTPAQIRILVVYTPQALAQVPSIRATIALLMDNLNATLSNSQIAAQATLAGIDQVNYPESSTLTSAKILQDVESGAGDFARIQSLRAAVGADLVSVISAFAESSGGTGVICGLASVNSNLDRITNLQSQVRYGDSTVSVSPDCTSSVQSSFAHEIGHNLGADHDRYVLTNPLPGPAFYAAGYVDTVGKFRDTMAYSTKCTDAGISCPRVVYYSNPNLTYNGRALGVADNLPEAADVARKIGEIAPYIAQFHTFLSAPANPVLAMLVSGTGTITSSPAGIACGNTCSASFTAGQQVTLTTSAPAGWSFSAWSGACTGSTTCSVSMSASRSVTATFLPTLRFGPVFSTAQSTSQSFIRVINTGASAGTATVKLSDYTSGTLLGLWTSPSIPAGTAQQFGISQIESALGAAAKPQYYAVAVQTEISGATQHVLWKPSDGTLTNLSTCDTGVTGVTASTGQVASVHSAVVGTAYPSSVAVNNTSASAVATLTLGIYDARDGTKLGTYPVPSIPANSKLVLTVAAIEAGAQITPTAGMYHYVIKTEGVFTGFLQHLVNNQLVGVITDMTTVCAFGAAPTAALTVAMRQPGPLYSTAQSDAQSFLRFANTGATAGTVAVTLRNSATGAKLGQWISPSIAAGAAQQYSISQIESESSIGGSKPQYYAAQIETQITGSVAHVLWKPSDGTLTNLSTCDAGISTTTAQVASVHSSLLDLNYPSSLAINNTGTTAQSATLGVFDARDGRRLSGYTTTAIPAGGQILVSMAMIEAAAGIVPTGTMYHYVIKIEGTFTGFLQHLVNNQARGVITDMTTVCQLPTKAVSYTDCAPGATPRCTATVGAATAGQLKQVSSWANYSIALTAGVAYSIQVKGVSTNNGTLAQPYIFVYGPSGGSSIAQGGGGGTGDDAKLSFTPTSSGTYTIQVTTYIFPDNAGTFVLTVQ
jgi:hypothetical protein